MRPPTLARWLAEMFAVGVVLGMPASASAASTEPQQVAASMLAEMRESMLDAQARANAIAAAPSIVYAVATDQQTMLDMTADELAFRAQRDEIVEIGQRQLATNKVVSLHREGRDAELVHLPLDRAGLRVIAAGERLYALAVVEVRPRERGDVVRGLVGVARVIDLSDARAHLERLGAAVLVRAGGVSVLYGHKPSPARAVTLRATLGTVADPEVMLLVPASRVALVGGLTAAGLLAFAVAFVLLRRR